ncbi:MAG TPA: YncE family protein [Polyangiaceae bacterium]|nr:YncE family protein [Polyangiaceae bacterium]
MRVSTALHRLLSPVITAALLVAPAASAQSATAPASTPQKLTLPGTPFGVVTSPDGRFAFASLSGPTQGIAVVERRVDGPHLLRVVPTAGGAFGLAVSRDGRTLLAAVQPQGVAFIDAHKAESSDADPVLGYVSLGDDAGAIEVHFSKDERLVFSSEENVEKIAVIDVEKALKSDFGASSVVGEVPVEQLPVGLAVSPNGRYLYVTSEEADAGTPGYDPTVCNIPAGSGTRPGAQGTITVIDIRRAGVDPATSIVSRAYAGCVPVRIVLSPGGEVAWVSQRAANALGAFSTARLLSDPEHALISATPVGVSPVGVQVFAGGLLVAVANSNRFADDPGTVSIVDATRALLGRKSAVLATLNVGVFPREWALSPLGDKLYLTEFRSSTLDVFDTAGLIHDILLGKITP